MTFKFFIDIFVWAKFLYPTSKIKKSGNVENPRSLSQRLLNRTMDGYFVTPHLFVKLAKKGTCGLWIFK